MLEVRPAAIADIAAIRPRLTGRALAQTVWHVTAGLSWRIDWRGEAAALFGIVPVDGAKCDEIWLMVARSMRGRADAWAFTRALTRRFAGLGWTRPVLMVVREGHRPGETMARAMGFTDTGRIDGVEPPARYWVWLP